MKAISLKMQGVKATSKLAVLVFDDEMVIKEGVFHNSRLDEVEGLQHLGTLGNTSLSSLLAVPLHMEHRLFPSTQAVPLHTGCSPPH